MHSRHARTQGKHRRMLQEILMNAVGQLAQEDVRAPHDLKGLCLDDVEGASTWLPEVRCFVKNICDQVRPCAISQILAEICMQCNKQKQ